jgi:hypothetical protein
MRMNLGSACYHSVQNLLSSPLQSNNVKTGLYRTIFLPVVLYGCETWSLTFRKEHRPRVSKNRVPRRIFRLQHNEVIAGWRKLHNEELHNLYSLPSIFRITKSRRMR